MQTYKAVLLLEDGKIYQGWSFLQSQSIAAGEIIFNTGMTGYQEIITDPSYSGQIIAFTYPELGNTGINLEDNESSQIHAKGIIAKNICQYPSNWRCEVTFIDYLINNKVMHIFGIDTRALTKHIREQGSMNACISSNLIETNKLNKTLDQLPKMSGLDLVKIVTTNKCYSWSNEIMPIKTFRHLSYKVNKTYGENLNILVLDFGVKFNILKRLSEYECNINIVPANSTFNQIMSYQPDGILLSNGPGDPSAVDYGIQLVKEILKVNIPIFGICMGHQILGLALGGKTFKLKFGHRGLNHPSGLVKTTEITSQNHGFAIEQGSLSVSYIQITHLNLNDKTIAGIVHLTKPVFSVQYHPEASPGPHDSEYLFKHFIRLAKEFKSSKTDNKIVN